MPYTQDQLQAARAYADAVIQHDRSGTEADFQARRAAYAQVWQVAGTHDQAHKLLALARTRIPNQRSTKNGR